MSFSSKLLWYVHRLCAMSVPEIFHRVQEAMLRKRDKHRLDMLRPAMLDRGTLPSLPKLRERATAWNPPASLLEQWKHAVSEAREQRFYLLGQAWPHTSAHEKWHLDPVSKKLWPHKQYCFDIDFRHVSGVGDVKYVWELGRLQYLHPAIMLAYKTNDAELAGWCLSEAESFIDHNPPYLGIHWASGIELGMRVVSLLLLCTLLGEHTTQAQRAKLWYSLEAHGIWLFRYPSKYSSANNHQTAEGMGLFLLGALCPSLSSAMLWKERGWSFLCDTAHLQLLADGVGAEQTLTYTAVVLEMLLLGRDVALHCGVTIPPAFDEKIHRAGIWLRWFTDSAGNQPFIGDNDNARVLGAYHKDETYVRDILGSVAAVTRDGALTPPSYTPHLREALFGTPPAPTAAPEGVRQFPHGGYTIGRHVTRGHNVMLAMDHGPLGYLSIAAHGHADALSVCLHIDGTPVLADAGTYLYHSGGAWRKYFRSTGIHNTLSIEGRDSSIMSGNFNWSHKARAWANALQSGTKSWCIEAQHDGYLKKYRALHTRKLHAFHDSGFAITDSITGSVPRQVVIHYLLHPSITCNTQEDGSLYLACEGAPLVKVNKQSSLTLKHIPANATEPGWYSETFGIKEPTSRLMLTGLLAPEEKSVTRFDFLF